MNSLVKTLAVLGLTSVFASCASSPESLQQSAPVQFGAGDAVAHVQQPLQDDPNDWPAPVHDNLRFTFVRAEQLEFRLPDSGPNLARWEVQGWHGTDYNKLWIKTEGEQSLEGASEGNTEFQALYSRLVAPFWDFQVGARYDRRWGAGPDLGRWFGVVGVQGFAPYEFETELALFVSEDADLSARLTASTDFLITQRLILQPRFETEVDVQEATEFQVGQGLNYSDLSLRLRYEIKREFAPYLGVNWLRSFGESEDLIRRNGGAADELAFVIGVSIWF
jgi:copper resistance protein B